MRVLIIYFSGTGNTKSIALGYGRALEKLGHVVSISSIENISTLEDHDLLIIGGPIYAGNVPHELIQWVRKNIPQTSGDKNAIVYSTSAGLENAHGVKSIANKLARRGYSIIDLTTYEMPRNFYIEKYDPTPETIQQQQFKDAAQKIVNSVETIHNAAPLISKDSVFKMDMLADLFSIMAKALGKNFMIDESCISCGACERECPKQNISFKNKRYYNRCILCTRCIHNCPVNAISYKGKKIEPYRVHHELLI